MVQIVKSVSELLNPEHLVQNSYLFAILSIFLGMYGPRLHPKLPESVKNLFNNPVFRATVLFLIAYLSSNNIQSSITIAIIFLVTMNLLHSSNVLDVLKKEGFQVNGPPVASCNTYNNESINLNGTAFYPLNDDAKFNKDNASRYAASEFDENEINYNNSVKSI